MTHALGGDFGSGFLSAAAVSYMGGVVDFEDSAAQVLQGAVVGGTASVISGGKFANGAVTGAFARLVDNVGAQEEPEFDMPSHEELMADNPQVVGVDFPQCVSTCIQSNYGSLYDTAGLLNPLSVIGYVGHEVTTHLTEKVRAEGSRNSYGDNNTYEDRSKYKTSQRQQKTLGQFRAFNAGMWVLGAGAVGFQVGAQAYCRFSCSDF